MIGYWPSSGTQALLLGLCVVLLPQIAGAGSPELVDADRVVILSDDVSNSATSVSHSSGGAPPADAPQVGSAGASGDGGDGGDEVSPDPVAAADEGGEGPAVAEEGGSEAETDKVEKSGDEKGGKAKDEKEKEDKKAKKDKKDGK